MSSANILIFESMKLGMSFMYKINTKGPSGNSRPDLQGGQVGNSITIIVWMYYKVEFQWGSCRIFVI